MLFNKKLDEITRTKQIKNCDYCLKEDKNFYRVIYDNNLVHFCSNECYNRFKAILELKNKINEWETERISYIKMRLRLK